MKKIVTLVLTAFLASALYGQNAKIPIISEIITIESESLRMPIEVLSVEKEGQKTYYLMLGDFGLGDEIIQVQFDPLFKLFIPLGQTLAEAQECMENLQGLFKQEPGTTVETKGSFSPTFPTDELETVKVTYRKQFLSRQLEFTLQREGYIRSAFVSKSDFGGLVSGIRFHRKIHPKEP